MADKNDAPGEGQIGIQQIIQLLPDILTPQGLEELNQKIQEATQEKENLDPIIKSIASQLNADHSSRIKNFSVALKKIAQKRSIGEDYSINNLNDLGGQRITLNNPDDEPDAIEKLNQASKDGHFKILKQQEINNESHHSYHVDAQTNNGSPFEIQILPSQQELADSIINHDIYSQWSQNPPPAYKQIRDEQTDIAKGLSNTKAKQLSKNVLDMHRANSDIPLDPAITAAAVLNSADKKTIDNLALPPIK